MEITVHKKSYNTFGGSFVYSPIRDLLTANLGDYGPAVQSLEITAYLPSRTRIFLPTLEELFDRFHNYIQNLPTITFRRNLNRLELSFLSSHLFEDDDKAPQQSVDKFNIAAAEVAEAMVLLKKRIKPTDAFDLEGFLADAIRLLGTPLETLAEWNQVRDRANEKRLARHANKSPWEKLDIDWNLYHPKAKEILDDPFFWECAEDTAPHGNDTGADLLEDFLHWEKRNRTASPLAFLDRLLKGWDIQPVDWAVTDTEAVREFNQAEPIGLSVCNEAIIALAFAVLKTRAACPPDITRMALDGLTRTSILVQDSNLNKETKSDWDRAIARMRSKLNSLLQGA